MRRLAFPVLLVATLYAARSGAPPPISSFPAELRPDGSGTVPTNARLWAFGKDAPPLAELGVAVTVAGEPVAVEVAALGCCAVRATPVVPLAVGDVVHATVTSAGNEASAGFEVDADVDEVPPTLLEPIVLDDSSGLLVVGVEGDDEVALAGFFARADGAVVGAAPPGYVLEAPVRPGGCVDVVAVDLAGNESAPRAACGRLDEVDAGAPPDGGAAGDLPSCGCAQSQGATLALLLLVLPRRARRARAHR